MAAALAMTGLAGQTALAQGRPAGAPATKTHAPARSAPKKMPVAPEGAASSAAVPPAAVALQSGGPASDAGVVEARTLDGGTHVFKFSELDIEGRLKSPQLVYFLRRVRAEFAADDLGHRSFLREMSETRKEASF